MLDRAGLVALLVSHGGYWVVDAAGRLRPLSPAVAMGDLTGQTLASPIVGAPPSPTGNGYWLVAADGGIFTFGDARFSG